MEEGKSVRDGNMVLQSDVFKTACTQYSMWYTNVLAICTAALFEPTISIFEHLVNQQLQSNHNTFAQSRQNEWKAIRLWVGCCLLYHHSEALSPDALDADAPFERLSVDKF
jgi:hypothetical protein